MTFYMTYLQIKCNQMVNGSLFVFLLFRTYYFLFTKTDKNKGCNVSGFKRSIFSSFVCFVVVIFDLVHDLMAIFHIP